MRAKRLILLVFLLAGATACHSAQVNWEPNWLPRTEPIRVANRLGTFSNDALKIGPYKVNDIYRSWNDGSVYGSARYGRRRKDQRFSFAFVTPESGTWSVRCKTDYKESSWRIWYWLRIGTGSVKLSCTLDTPPLGDNHTYAMTLKGHSPNLKGSVQFGRIQLKIRSAGDATRGRRIPMPQGFQILLAGPPPPEGEEAPEPTKDELVGAVDWGHDAELYVVDNLDPEMHAVVGAAGTALLLMKYPL